MAALSQSSPEVHVTVEAEEEGGQRRSSRLRRLRTTGLPSARSTTLSPSPNGAGDLGLLSPHARAGHRRRGSISQGVLDLESAFLSSGSSSASGTEKSGGSGSGSGSSSSSSTFSSDEVADGGEGASVRQRRRKVKATSGNDRSRSDVDKLAKLVKLKRKLKEKVQVLKARKVKAYLIKPVYAEYSRVSKAIKALKTKQALSAFQVIDTDGNGTLSVSEFASLVRRIVPTFSDADVDSAFSSLDLDASATISRDEFVAWWESFDRTDNKMVNLRRKLGNWEQLSAATAEGSMSAGPELGSSSPPVNSVAARRARRTKAKRKQSSALLQHSRSAVSVHLAASPQSPAGTWPRISAYQYRLNPTKPSLAKYFPFWEDFYTAPFLVASISRIPVEMLLRVLLSPQPYLYEVADAVAPEVDIRVSDPELLLRSRSM